jgi:glycerophosphoryl diester phosphodiesterase
MKRGEIAVIGHGGAGDFFPGNSRASIQKAIDLGVDRIEIDILATADGDLILVHDETVETDPGVRQKVRRLPTDRVRERVDEMLTLDEFFEMIGRDMPVLLDLKRPGYEREIAETLHRHSGRDVWISTTHVLSILRLRSVLPDVTFGLSTGHVATAVSKAPIEATLVRVVRAVTAIPLLIAAKFCGARMIMVNFRACSPWLTRVAQAGGIAVDVWTVNRPADIRRMVAMGVNAITSNRPDLVREILED